MRNGGLLTRSASEGFYLNSSLALRVGRAFPYRRENNVTLKFIKKKGLLLLAIWLILQGVIPLLKAPSGVAEYFPLVLAILAVVAGMLILLDW